MPACMRDFFFYMGQNDIAVKVSLTYNGKCFEEVPFALNLSCSTAIATVTLKSGSTGVLLYIIHVSYDEKNIFGVGILFFFSNLDCFAHTQILYGTFKTNIITI